MNEDKPKLCYYYKKGAEMETCKSNRYRDENYNLSKIVAMEQKHTVVINISHNYFTWHHFRKNVHTIYCTLF